MAPHAEASPRTHSAVPSTKRSSDNELVSVGSTASFISENLAELFEDNVPAKILRTATLGLVNNVGWAALRYLYPH